MAVHGRSAEPMGAHWDGKIANEWNIRNKTRRDIIKLKRAKLRCKCCEAGDANSKLCAGQATKNVLVDHSAEPAGAH